MNIYSPAEILSHFHQATHGAQAISLALGVASLFATIKIIQFILDGIRRMKNTAKMWFLGSAVAGSNFFDTGHVWTFLSQKLGFAHIFELSDHLDKVIHLTTH